jgi:hypothetical protein
MQPTKEQLSRLKEVIEKFPELKELAWKLNQAGVFWGIASGTATFIYAGERKLHDICIWAAPEDKMVVSEATGLEWESNVSDRHQSENIRTGSLDIFTNCRRTRGDEVLIDYRWTKSVDEHLREVALGGVNYRIVSPEDVVSLKMVNPREKDTQDVLLLEKLDLDKDYLRRRLAECGVTVMTG